MANTDTIHVKNMVCDRCIMVVKDILHQEGLEAADVQLGRVVLQAPLDEDGRMRLRKALERYGFELLDDKRQRIIEQIKVAVIELVHQPAMPDRVNLSQYLTAKIGRDYSMLSKLFSEAKGMSIEKYYIAQKTERAKELLVYDELTVSEIAYRLNYSSVAHFSAQFRSITGLSPSQFKKLASPGLKPLDSI